MHRNSFVTALPLVGVLASSALCSTAHADLVVLAGGDIFKVERWELVGDRMRLNLPGGGSLTLPLGRVERVVDDEIEADGEPFPEPAFALGFDGSQQVPDTPFGELMFAAGREHALNPQLLAAMARAESSFDPGALSTKGARGLLQLMPATAERFGIGADELWDPGRNLEAAARYLRWLIERFDGDLARILAAYNAGEGVVERYDGVPPYRETRDFVGRIYGYLGLDRPGV